MQKIYVLDMQKQRSVYSDQRMQLSLRLLGVYLSLFLCVFVEGGMLTYFESVQSLLVMLGLFDIVICLSLCCGIGSFSSLIYLPLPWVPLGKRMFMIFVGIGELLFWLIYIFHLLQGWWTTCSSYTFILSSHLIKFLLLSKRI